MVVRPQPVAMDQSPEAPPPDHHCREVHVSPPPLLGGDEQRDEAVAEQAEPRPWARLGAIALDGVLPGSRRRRRSLRASPSAVGSGLNRQGERR